MSEKIIMYGHNACPMVPPIRGLLKQSRVAFEYVNIRENSGAAARVREINHGHESVPTLVFPDGSVLTEPGTGEIKKKLEEMGYSVPLRAQIIGNLPVIIMSAIALFAILRFLGVI